MTTRTRQKTARFYHPFKLKGFDVELPAGEYDIDEDEELIEGMSRIAYRRVATFLHVPAKGTKSATRKVVLIDHSELEKALERDRESASANDNG